MYFVCFYDDCSMNSSLMLNGDMYPLTLGVYVFNRVLVLYHSWALLMIVPRNQYVE